ncbi:histidine kinase N-terminal 7TM domain-containing protein [Planomicrobium sp. CPCC 101110]|uniref:histidine kinase N-terminal 7TM domain-containing diguanylate cyclase n=1 Tax=Planomicrobium sp. CPCC 101110 TaxID=2599619 RepID=UPI0011B862A9|nr:histidine kinase N-terminal 7TM domain-containing protein [Planomicrobium sp. CPCC 101110]TWT27110.1 diguanylate cyclase [Planomicrobium sp. CPCC 101110]
MEIAYELIKYILVVALGGGISLSLAIYAFLKLSNAPGGKYFVLATASSAVFTLAYAFELASTTLEEIKFWLKIEYIALPFLPLFILLMCFDYVGQRVKREVKNTLFAIAALTVFMQTTNDFHHFYYTTVGLKEDSPFAIADLVGGPWFYVHSLFLYGCIGASMAILFKQIKNKVFQFRMQVLLMMAGVLVPVIASFFYLSGVSPHGIDLGPVFMSVSFILHGIALLPLQMFNVAPIARDTIFESMEEGAIVLNRDNIIVDYNKASLKVLPVLQNRAIGKRIGEVLSGSRLLERIILREQKCDYELYINEELLHFQIRFSPVRNKNDILVGKIVTFVNVTERVEMERALKQLASIDGLTQVFNRTCFLEKAEEAFGRLSHQGGLASVIMFDIDHFKRVNDTYGHATGDTVLTYIAQSAKESLQETDILGRYGGEEFVICLPNTSMEAAQEVADDFRKQISESYLLIDGKRIDLTLSFGVSEVQIEAGDFSNSIQAVMGEADQALYLAKEKGRNRVELFKNRLCSFEKA